MIKKLTYILAFCCLVSIFIKTSEAATIEHIENFQTNITVEDSGKIQVTEIIDYNFGSYQRHGIIRDIPYTKTNQDGKIYKMDIKVNSITDENGKKHDYSKSTIANTDGAKISLKIGDANKYVSGTKTYIINYTVSGALTYFSDHDELYWNVLGTEWEVPVNNFSSHVTLPNTVPNQNVELICYSGVVGATTQNCTASKTNAGVTVTADSLNSYEGVTLALSFPKGHVAQLEPEEWHLIDPLVLKLLLIGAAIFAVLNYIVYPIKLLIGIIKEQQFIKKNAKIVTAWFDPPQNADGTNYSPAETALLLEPWIDQKKITATLIDLAHRKHIKIRLEDNKVPLLKDKVILEKLTTGENDLQPFEHDLLNLYFADDTTEVDLSKVKLTYSFSKELLTIKKDIGNSLKTKGDAQKSADDIFKKRSALVGLGIFTLNLPLLILAYFIRKYQKLTQKGVEQYAFAKSLKNFIVTQDEQYDFQAEKQMFFEKLLPYATAFGVEDIWVKRFPDINLNEVTGLEGVINLAALHTINSAVASSGFTQASTTRSSSGFSSGFSGGSSGGGGGGGGGSSW